MIGPDPNFKVFNEEIEVTLKELGAVLGGALPEGWGFTLLLFDFNNATDGQLFYISNGERKDVIKMMEEFMKKVKEEK